MGVDKVGDHASVGGIGRAHEIIRERELRVDRGDGEDEDEEDEEQEDGGPRLEDLESRSVGGSEYGAPIGYLGLPKSRSGLAT
jgi:hypothetical protein